MSEAYAIFFINGKYVVRFCSSYGTVCQPFSFKYINMEIYHNGENAVITTRSVYLFKMMSHFTITWIWMPDGKKRIGLERWWESSFVVRFIIPNIFFFHRRKTFFFLKHHNTRKIFAKKKNNLVSTIFFMWKTYLKTNTSCS